MTREMWQGPSTLSRTMLRPRAVVLTVLLSMPIASCGLSITTNHDEASAPQPTEPSFMVLAAATVDDSVEETSGAQAEDRGMQAGGVELAGPGEVPELSSEWDPRQVALTNENDRSSSVGALCWAVREITRLEHLLFIEQLIADGLYVPSSSDQGHVGTVDDGTQSVEAPSDNAFGSIISDSEEPVSHPSAADDEDDTAVDAAITAVRDAARLVSDANYLALVDESTLPANVAVFADEFFAATGRMAKSESYVATDIEVLANSDDFSELVSDNEDCVFP